MESKLSLVSLLVLAFAASVESQEIPADIDPSLLIRPGEGIDFPGCFSDLVRADRNSDGVVRQAEYLGFIQEYGKRKCLVNPELSLQQAGVFNQLACECKAMGQPDTCCLGQNANIPNAGALDKTTRTESQLQYLTQVCKLTDATLPDSKCPPVVLDREAPPPVIVTPIAAPVIPPAGGGGLSDAAMWGIIAAVAALLLALCCCCWVCRKKRQDALEEEEMIEEQGMGNKGADIEEAPEQPKESASTPRDMPLIPPPGVPRSGDEESDEEDGRRRGGDGDIDDEWDEDGNKRRGGNLADPPIDTTKRRLHGEGEIPDDPFNPERVVLNPIPDPNPDPDPEWDYPGRQIDDRKPEPDEMSAQEFDPYNPDGGVYFPEREGRDPVGMPKLAWDRLKKDVPDEVDQRKRRVQAGLGEGEVWNSLEQADDDHSQHGGAPDGDVFDWVVQSALGCLDKNDQATPDTQTH
jgi:hypothetical protein